MGIASLVAAGVVADLLASAVKMFKKTICLLLVIVFGYYWQTRILQGPIYESDKSLSGKTVIITGGNAGIGKTTAIEVAKRNARVVIASRNLAKSEEAKKEIIEITGNKNIKTIKLDLEDFDSVRKVASELIETEDHIDYLINNAGVIYLNGLTKQGLSRVFTINHLGHFLLTNLLLNKMKEQSNKRPVRIINVSSEAYKFGELDWENLHFDPEGFTEQFRSYGNSKLANVYFTSELHRRLEGYDITTYSLHPGAIVTEIGRNVPKTIAKILNIVTYPFLRDVIYGVQTIMYTMLDDDVVQHSGKYFNNCALEELIESATNQTLGEELWDKSVEMIDLVA